MIALLPDNIQISPFTNFTIIERVIDKKSMKIVVINEKFKDDDVKDLESFRELHIFYKES
jgi:hypothetical protein